MSARKTHPETAWTEILRAACAGGSQRQVAQKIGYSVTVVSQVLSGSYKGDLARVKAAVEGALMQAEVECPVCGVIPRQRCVEHQRKPFMTTSPMRVALYKACRGGCPHALTNSDSAPHPTRNAQPAVASNTGSREEVPPFASETRPTGPRKGLSNIKHREKR